MNDIIGGLLFVAWLLFLMGLQIVVMAAWDAYRYRHNRRHR